MSKIVIMKSLGISDSELAMRKKPFEEAGHTFVDYPKTTDTEKLIRQAKDADAMIIAHMPMPISKICSSPITPIRTSFFFSFNGEKI